MAQVIHHPRARQGVHLRMQLSEIAIFFALAIAIVLGARWYVFVYRASPGVALGQFIGAIKAGNSQQQYAMLDAADKQLWPTQADYAKSQLAYGYVERIESVTIGPAVADPNDPSVVTLQVTLGLRAPSQGRALYQTGPEETATDTYVLRKDPDGVWKIWLSRSLPQNLLRITPNAPGESF